MNKAASYETIFFNIFPQNTSPVVLFPKSYLKKKRKKKLSKNSCPFPWKQQGLAVVFLGEATSWYFIWMHIARSTDAKAITQSAQVGWPTMLRVHTGAIQRNEVQAQNKNISTALYLILYCCTCYPPLYETTALLQHFMAADGNILYNELFSYTYQICYMSSISLLGYYPIVYYFDVLCNLLPPLFLSLTFSFA